MLLDAGLSSAGSRFQKHKFVFLHDSRDAHHAHSLLARVGVKRFTENPVILSGLTLRTYDIYLIFIYV